MTSKTTTTHRGSDGKTYRTETTRYNNGASESVTRDVSNRTVLYDSGPIVSVTKTDGKKK
jgi:hypothetical protein